MKLAELGIIVAVLALGVSFASAYISLRIFRETRRQAFVDQVESAHRLLSHNVLRATKCIDAIANRSHVMVGRDHEGRPVVAGAPQFGPFDDYSRPLLPEGHALKELLEKADQAASAAIDEAGEKYRSLAGGIGCDIGQSATKLAMAAELLSELATAIKKERSMRFLW